MAGTLVSEPAKAVPKDSNAFRNTWVSLPNVLTLLFALVGGLLMAHHVLWRDEAQAFLIARDSHSLRDLLAYVRYEGHPPLWYLLLFLATRITQRPELMQWLHLAMAATTVYLVVRFAPFPWLAKVLFPFGYFTLFEYGILSRNYQLILLPVVLFCVIYNRQPRAYTRIGIVLFLLCLSHVLGVILASVLGLTLLVEATTTQAGRLAVGQHRSAFLLGTVIAALGAALAVLVLIPPENAMVLRAWSWDFSGNHIHHTLSALWNAYVPIAPWTEHFWNGTIVDEDLMERWGLVLAVMVVLCVITSWRALIVLVLGQFGVLVFLHVKYFGYMRHHGTLFVAAIAAFWIAWYERGQERPKMRYTAVIERWLPRTLFVGLLAVQAYAVIVPVYYSWHIPFSPGHAAARALLSELKNGEPVVVTLDGTVSSLAAYAPGRKFFFPWGARWGTFAMYRKEFYFNWLRADDGLWWAKKLANERKTPVMLVNPGPILPLPNKVTALGRYAMGIVGDEQYFLYRVQPQPERSE